METDDDGGHVAGLNDPCTCGGNVHITDHDVSCPAGLYQAGIDRGRKEALRDAAKLVRGLQGAHGLIFQEAAADCIEKLAQ